MQDSISFPEALNLQNYIAVFTQTSMGKYMLIESYVGIMVTIIPIMILYFTFSKRVIGGMVTGAVKGWRMEGKCLRNYCFICKL